MTQSPWPGGAASSPTPLPAEGRPLELLESRPEHGGSAPLIAAASESLPVPPCASSFKPGPGPRTAAVGGGGGVGESLWLVRQSSRRPAAVAADLAIVKSESSASRPGSCQLSQSDGQSNGLSNARTNIQNGCCDGQCNVVANALVRGEEDFVEKMVHPAPITGSALTHRVCCPSRPQSRPQSLSLNDLCLIRKRRGNLRWEGGLCQGAPAGRDDPMAVARGHDQMDVVRAKGEIAMM